MSGYNYHPEYFLRCHSRMKEDRADIKTKVWACSFEPDPMHAEKNTYMVATVGANSVCVIDVRTDQVEHKYYAEDASEEFYTIAWTTLHMRHEERQWRSNIFAVAGRAATIHLIHPEQKVCFARKSFKGINGKKAGSGIASMVFHPLSKTVLIAGFSDGRIMLLDIGNPSFPDYKSHVIELHSLYAPSKEITILTFSPHCEMLLVGTDDGLICWSLGLTEMNNNFYTEPKRWKITFPLKSKFGSQQLIDSVEVIRDGLIATKCALYGEIYVWNLEKVKKFENDVVVVPDLTFRFSDTDNYYMAMGSHPSSGLLCCGDDKGRIWMYDVDTIALGIQEPIQILPWPVVNDPVADRQRKLHQDVYDIVMNKVSVNHSGEYIVAVSSTNLVCIWKKKF